ncbi:hypothetical protein AMTR_s00028p00239670 [Amborella trichopoda]|uniref:Uncharacterized protein n=1 Tax=Amborella trichopoda TaxID=13333 RepID=W1PS89_AMBTC|nr:hypothetical protein AMTR_s00028p00239670 [Amborella trichopoda]
MSSTIFKASLLTLDGTSITGVLLLPAVSHASILMLSPTSIMILVMESLKVGWFDQRCILIGVWDRRLFDPDDIGSSDEDELDWTWTSTGGSLENGVSGFSGSIVTPPSVDLYVSSAVLLS